MDRERIRFPRDLDQLRVQAALALITGAYTVAPVRVETCVQHGTRNKPQWARKTTVKVNVMNGGSL